MERIVPGVSWRAALLTLGPLRHGGRDPSYQLRDGVLWRTTDTPDGPVTLALRPHVDGVRGTAWGPGADWQLSTLPRLLGRDQDWSALDVSGVAVIRDVHRANPELRLPSTGTVLGSLVAAVLEQKVTGKEAKEAWFGLLRRHGRPAPGPGPAGLRVPPDGPTLLAVPTWDWHRWSVDSKRQRAVRAVATVADRLDRLADAPAAEAERLLQTVPGVGAWTAAEVTLRSHGHADAVSVGDAHVHDDVVHALTGRPRGTDEEMLALLAPWAGQRGRVVRLIEVSGIHAPRFGPRMTVTRHWSSAGR